MKRKIAVAIAVAALVGGGAYTAVAASGDTSPSSSVSASEAAGAALKKSPGSVESISREDDDKGDWEVEVVGKDGNDRDVRVDISNGKASLFSDDDDTNENDKNDSDDQTEREALRTAKVNAEQAVTAAQKFRAGTVTEVDFGQDHWEIEVRAEDGREHEVRVDATTGKASASVDSDNDSDDRDDRDDRDDNDND
ncbi:PepSY domain-containing protein [Streptomyces albipurpureus]|uniref:PepSY domain-containing protein n=1 Tax=Streptomyces albipurpureus TaxID=2897419 RepID=A0ABT0UHE9_9ACTN|nr:PepSY domain-containing protein [Streptomyces sp. CWNU-1]MCM2387855.1 PepSY domain-containing protein [Streptomyces sp. CWNU-1]